MVYDPLSLVTDGGYVFFFIHMIIYPSYNLLQLWFKNTVKWLLQYFSLVANYTKIHETTQLNLNILSNHKGQV